MTLKEIKQQACLLLAELGIDDVSPNWIGCDPVWKAFEKMRAEGAVVVIKLDGERMQANDNGRYTVVVSGPPLGDNFFRIDCNVLEEGLAKAIIHYAAVCWKNLG